MHQARASCNGMRDPTAYVKKSQLATAAGVDHDYNFLSKIERAIDQPTALVSKADQSSRNEENKTLQTAGRSNAEKKRWNADGTLVRYLHDNRIRVDRAPTGLSRQKANMTRYLQKSKRIVWSVEWVKSNGDKIMSEVFEGTTIEEAWKDVLKERCKKRKREEDQVDSTSNPRAQPHEHQSGSADTTVISRSTDTATSTQPETPDHTKPPTVENATHQEETTAAQHFYLEKPHTPSNIKVLIPLEPTSSLTSSLRDRVLLEFPTIYQLAQPAESLPPNYINEEAYLSQSGTSSRRVGDITIDAVGGRKEKLQGGIFASGADNGTEDDEDPELDEKSILDMLKRDTRS